jgi:transposase-like protein
MTDSLVKQKINEFKQELVAQMKVDYLAGMPVDKIFAKHGVTRASFYRWIKFTKEERLEHFRNYLLSEDAPAEEVKNEPEATNSEPTQSQ